MLAMDKVDALYDRNIERRGPDFASAVLRDVGTSYSVWNHEVIGSLPNGPFITISNHPYGHVDGLILVDLFGHFRNDFKVMVNGILGRIEPMMDSFICVTPVGDKPSSPSPDSIRGIKEALEHVRNGHPLGLFPAGAVSDLSLKDRCIRDREWQEPVIRLIRKLDVPILPVAFLDGNSTFYYSLGLIDWRLRLLRLPAEVFNKKGMVQRIALGKVILPSEQEQFCDLKEFSGFLRHKVYELKSQML